jgi:L-iditol 2-dehydrogenase
VYVTEKIPERIEHGKCLNPDWIGSPEQNNIVEEINKREPLGVDVVYECSGDPETIKQAIGILKPGGALILVGIAEADTVPFPTHELRRKEIPVISIRRQVHCTQKAIDLITSGKTNVGELATHHFPLEETAQAFDLAANYRDGVMKAMIMLNPVNV